MSVKPFGGINFFVSLLIIAISKAKEKIFGKKEIKTQKKNRPLKGISILIIGTIFIMLFYIIIGNSLARTIYFHQNCEILYHEVGERNIILRVDDIQADSWIEIQKRIILDAKRRGFPLILGIIPNLNDYIEFNDDSEIYRIVEQNKCNMEIALHGYNHKLEGEFSSLSFKEADSKIKAGLKILKTLGTTVYTFIPPNNEISKEAINATESNGINVISAWDLTSRYKLDAVTLNAPDQNTEEYPEILNQCGQALDEGVICVIVIHPQDYINKDGSLDKTKYEGYLKLLDGIKGLNANVVNIRDFYYQNSIHLS